MAASPSAHRSAFRGVDVPNYDFIVNCMHCGLCLPHCPTYSLTGLEKSSPRGRIRLIKAVADGELTITPGFVEEMNFCLDCQACETACPAGVQYGALVEAARAQIHAQGYEGVASRVLKRLLLEWTFRSPRRLRILATLVRAYQRSGLEWFVQKTGILALVSDRLHKIERLAPRISERYSRDFYGERVRPAKPVRFRVGFLTGCIMDLAFADVNIDTIELLLHHGCEVIIPPGQGCCGSLQAHNGSMQVARELAANNLDAFPVEELDAIVVNSAGCSAYMKEYGHIFANDPHRRDKARALSTKVKDVTEFLVETGFQPPQKKSARYAGARVTYHDACHLVHTQKVSRQPRELLRAIDGIEYVELPESTWCCGSAGIYNLVRYDDARKLLHRKVENIKSVEPDILVTGNPGCLIQIHHGLQNEGMRVELLHTATFLRRVYET